LARVTMKTAAKCDM